MPVAPVRVDDEVLFRVITGGATETEREAIAVWLQSSSANVERFRELGATLEALNRDETSIRVPPAPALSAILARARLAGGPRVEPRRRPLIGPVSVGLTAVILAVGALMEMREPEKAIELRFGGERFTTDRGNSVAATLLDGTQIELGPRSSISTELKGDVREVLLDGRASFRVARQGSRSFVVRTATGEVRDIGTHFTVRADRGSTQVAVFEGRVGFSSAGGSAEAAAGELIATHPAGPPVVSRLEAGHSPSDWVRADLVFEGTTVNEIAKIIEDHYGVRVHVADAGVGHRTVSAWFVDEPGLEEVFAAICRAVDASCSVEGSRRVISQAFVAKETL